MRRLVAIAVVMRMPLFRVRVGMSRKMDVGTMRLIGNLRLRRAMRNGHAADQQLHNHQDRCQKSHLFLLTNKDRTAQSEPHQCLAARRRPSSSLVKVAINT
jgi:hypothetical protein